MRRIIALVLIALFSLQTTASAAVPGQIQGPNVQPLLSAIEGTQIFALLTGQEARYEATHAPAPHYARPTNLRPTEEQLKLSRSRIVHGLARYGTPRLLHLSLYANRARAGKDPLAMGGPGSATAVPGGRGSVRVTNCPLSVGRFRPMGCVQTPSPSPKPTPTPTPTPVPPTPTPSPTPTPTPTPRPTPTPTPTPIPVTPTPSPTATPVGTLPAATTGINRWWTYEEGAIPGLGKWMLNVADGNLIVQADDVDVSERGIDLAFRRTYNSQSRHDAAGSDGSAPSAFGNGWTNTFDAHLAYNGLVMSVYDIDGARYDYASNGSGGWTAPPGMQGVTLVYDGGCGYEWTKKTGTMYYFAEPTAQSGCTATPPAANFGRLQYIQGRNANNEITFTYSWSGDGSNPNQLTQIVAQHSDGDSVTLGFSLISGSPELASVTRPDNLQVTYAYDAAGDLIGVQRPGNNTISELPESYSYNTGTHVMAGAAGPRYTINYDACGSSACVTDGDSVAFSYSGASLTMVQDYGVVNFTPADGISSSLACGGLLQCGVASSAQIWHTEEFAGDSGVPSGTSGGVTNVTDNFGHARAWTYDGFGRITETQEWAAPTSGTPLATNATWDAGNDLTSSTDVAGNLTSFTYDANGNSLSVQAPAVQTSMGRGSPTSLYTYDANNNLVTYCDPNWVWQHGASSCPASTSTAYYRYTATPAEPFGELTATFDAIGYEYQLTYDNYGEPTRVQGTQMSQLDGTTRQPTQTFGYDGYGDLTSYNKGNGTWALTYDPMRRPLTRTDPDNFISYTYYNNDGSVSKTETAYQHANSWGSTATYDADGNATAQTSYRQSVPSGPPVNATPSPETTTKYYDGADRLVEVKQPQDAAYDVYANPWITRYLYDLTGSTTLNFNSAIDYSAYGNLYKTQELLAPGSGSVTATSPAPLSLANTSFQDLKGTAYDGLDRPIDNYSLVVANGGSSDSLSAEALSYDGTNEYGTFPGQLVSDCSALSQCKYPGYDALERQWEIAFSDSLSPSRTTSFDPDGRVMSVSSAAYGAQQYTYDADGRKLTEQEASGGGVTSAALFSHVYYADGKLEQLNVSSSGLSQSGLFQYSYRADGLVQTQTINDSTQANVGSTALAFTYYPSGRAEGRSESGPGGNPNPTSWSYDGYGRLAQVNYPACGAACNNLNTGIGYEQYDPQGTLLSYYYEPVNEYEGGYQYTQRGELASADPAPLGPQNMFANGVQVQAYSGVYAAEGYTATTTWDPRSGASLAKSTATPYTNNGIQFVSTTGSTFSYDQAGRLTSTASATSGGLYPESDSLSRTYDDENHTISSSDNGTLSQVVTAYGWGPTGHMIRIGSASGTTNVSSVQYDTLHWDGDQLVFETNSSGAVDDIKIGTNGDITPSDPSFTGLTFWDRGPANAVTGATIAFCHNVNGTSLATQSIASNQDTCAVGPSTLVFSSAPHRAHATGQDPATDYTVGIGQGLVLGMGRADGLTDGLNTIQGVRVMDTTAGTWTTPDAYAGDVGDPGSQKSYMWNNNNAVTYSDPTGFSAVPDYDSFNDPAIGPPNRNGDADAATANGDVAKLVSVIIDESQYNGSAAAQGATTPLAILVDAAAHAYVDGPVLADGSQVRPGTQTVSELVENADNFLVKKGVDTSEESGAGGVAGLHARFSDGQTGDMIFTKAEITVSLNDTRGGVIVNEYSEVRWQWDPGANGRKFNGGYPVWRMWFAGDRIWLPINMQSDPGR